METTIRQCRNEDYPKLVEIWEDSVRSSHTFLADDDITEIREKLTSLYFPSVKMFVAVYEDEIVGFMGLSGCKIEMLFISTGRQKAGTGRRFIELAKDKGCRFVDVNEQNTGALSFYQKCGFKIISRDETDDAGRPFPILHLSL
ncbi:MAG: GNAT family N-acetyltransferase [Bacteroidales bacterium]|nr:GNAT family N-acetyltransferase [Bacteroidales bacterium]